LVSLPAAVATELQIAVPADARQMMLVLADGRTIAARGVTLQRVRVGPFEAENVEAAVLDASATGAEPLLGMSYLGNFRFEIDAAEKSLKMLRVSTD
jgi:aspartyl protease family protein